MGLISDKVIWSCCVLVTFLVPREVVGLQCTFELIEDCLTNEEDRLVDARNLTVGVLENGHWGLMGTAEINVKRIPLITMEFTKCASKQEPETCMFFSTVRYKKACPMLEAKDEMWSSFFQKSEPPMKCPIAGSYSFEKSFLDMDKGQTLPGLEGFYWKIKATVIIDKKTVGCFGIEVSTL